MKKITDILPFPPKVATRLGIIILAALMVEAISVARYSYVRGLLEDELESRAEMALSQKVETIRSTLGSAESTMHEHLWDIRSHLSEPDSMPAVTRRLISSNSLLIGGEIAFVPDYYPGKHRLFEPYAHKSGGAIQVENLAGDGHDYTLHPAFQQALATGEPIWSDPYVYGEGDNAFTLTTFSYPLKDSEGRTAAVCGLDIDLSWLSEMLNDKPLYPSSYCLMLTKAGEHVGGPSGQERAQQFTSLIAAHEAGCTHPDGENIHLIRFRDSSDGSRAHLYYTSMPEEPFWQVAMVSYDRQIFEPARNMRLWSSLMNLLALLILFFIIRRYARGERALHAAEVEQARIGSELRVARDIQMQMLPKPLAERADLDVCGKVWPAKEVGGDLYDIFIRDGKLFFSIGDVSGKSVPAAMLMSSTHTLFRLVSEHDDNPMHIVMAINQVASRDNDANMFITFFAGVLDLASGRLRYCNAGHDRPLLVGDSVEELEAESNMPVGVFEDTAFVAQECVLKPGTAIFLYTDGVTEANDKSRRMFSLERLKESLAAVRQESAKTMVESVRKDIKHFAQGAQQNDDITILAIRYNPQENNI